MLKTQTHQAKLAFRQCKGRLAGKFACRHHTPFSLLTNAKQELLAASKTNKQTNKTGSDARPIENQKQRWKCKKHEKHHHTHQGWGWCSPSCHCRSCRRSAWWAAKIKEMKARDQTFVTCLAHGTKEKKNDPEDDYTAYTMEQHQPFCLQLKMSSSISQ